MAELAVAAQAGGRVVAQPVRDEVPRELRAEAVERGRVPSRERREASSFSRSRSRRTSAAPTAPRGGGGARARDAEPAARRRNGTTQSSRRERPVDVESGDDRARGRGFGHRRTRLYTRCMSDGPEIFDDLYLGLQAGGALRKQRRGEELTEEEREAIGRWQQMSMWRKGVAVGAFAVGTFGLGFTLGGLVFGRRARKA